VEYVKEMYMYFLDEYIVLHILERKMLYCPNKRHYQRDWMYLESKADTLAVPERVPVIGISACISL